MFDDKEKMYYMRVNVRYKILSENLSVFNTPPILSIVSYLNKLFDENKKSNLFLVKNILYGKVYVGPFSLQDGSSSCLYLESLHSYLNLTNLGFCGLNSILYWISAHSSLNTIERLFYSHSLLNKNKNYIFFLKLAKFKIK